MPSTLQDKIDRCQDLFTHVDIKVRNGKVWARGIIERLPRNSSGGKSETKEAEGDTLEECLDRLLPAPEVTE